MHEIQGENIKNEVIINGKIIDYDFMDENKKEGREWHEKIIPKQKIRYLGKSKIGYHNGRKEVERKPYYFWKYVD